jgi:hypothetical protein
MNSHVRITKAGLQSFARIEGIDDRAAVQIETFVSEFRLPCTIDPEVTLLDMFHAVERDLALAIKGVEVEDFDVRLAELERAAEENKNRR